MPDSGLSGAGTGGAPSAVVRFAAAPDDAGSSAAGSTPDPASSGRAADPMLRVQSTAASRIRPRWSASSAEKRCSTNVTPSGATLAAGSDATSSAAGIATRNAMSRWLSNMSWSSSVAGATFSEPACTVIGFSKKAWREASGQSIEASPSFRFFISAGKVARTCLRGSGEPVTQGWRVDAVFVAKDQRARGKWHAPFADNGSGGAAGSRGRAASQPYRRGTHRSRPDGAPSVDTCC